MELKRPLPADRTYEEVKNHYQVEKAIADELKKANRKERKSIYRTMYDRLFAQVPDHPRLRQRANEDLTLEANRKKWSLLARFIDESVTFAEFAPGDCRFLAEVARWVDYAYGIDISDQRGQTEGIWPRNAQLIIYDGYDLAEIPTEKIDVVFSDQLIEHLHPEDTKNHFALVRRILRPGGVYIFRTPHYLTGPHDVSKYFSEEPEGFHLKEWDYRGIRKLISDVGYSGLSTYWHAKGYSFRLPFFYYHFLEEVFDLLPKSKSRIIARVLIPTICGLARK